MNSHIEYYLCLLASTLMWIGMKVNKLLNTKCIEKCTNPEDKCAISETIFKKKKKNKLLSNQTVVYTKK